MKIIQIKPCISNRICYNNSMKINRSVKLSLKFATQKKRDLLEVIQTEYSAVVNNYIDLFWLTGIQKYNLTKDVLNQTTTWFSQRMKQTAAREALDLCKASTKKDQEKPLKPLHKGSGMQLSSAICTLVPSKNADTYDVWLQFRCLGSKLKLDIPLKLHRQFHKWNSQGKLLKSFVILNNSVQLTFEIDTGKKKKITNAVGIDTGINALASLSTGEQLGKGLKEHINNVKRKQYGSKGHKRAIKTQKYYMASIAKQIVQADVSLIVVEDLKNITKNTKLKGRLSKNIRSSIGKWNVSFWLNRVKLLCEENRVSLRRVSPYKTSQTCSKCGFTDRRNRSKEKFLCLQCNQEMNSDINAAKNILDRFLTGKYGSGYKTETMLFKY